MTDKEFVEYLQSKFPTSDVDFKDKIIICRNFNLKTAISICFSYMYNVGSNECREIIKRELIIRANNTEHKLKIILELPELFASSP